MEPSSFPKQYGGELEWNWGDMPSLDDSAKEVTGGLQVPREEEGSSEKEFIKGPVVWHGDRVDALGSVDGKERRIEIPVPKKEPVEEKKVAEKDGEDKKESSGDDDATPVNERVVPVFLENEKVGDDAAATTDSNGAAVAPGSDQKSAAAVAA